MSNGDPLSNGNGNPWYAKLAIAWGAPIGIIFALLYFQHIDARDQREDAKERDRAWQGVVQKNTEVMTQVVEAIKESNRLRLERHSTSR